MTLADVPPPGGSQYITQFNAGGTTQGAAGNAQVQGTDSVDFEDFQLEQDYLEQAKQDSVDTFAYNLLEANPIAPGSTEHIQFQFSTREDSDSTSGSGSSGGSGGTDGARGTDSGGNIVQFADTSGARGSGGAGSGGAGSGGDGTGGDGSSGIAGTSGSSGTGDTERMTVITTSGTPTTEGAKSTVGGGTVAHPKGNAWFSPNPAVAFLLAYQLVEKLLEKQSLSSSHLIQVEMNMSLTNAKAQAVTDIDIGTAEASSLYDQGIISATMAGVDLVQMGVSLGSLKASSTECSNSIDDSAYSNKVYGSKEDSLPEGALADGYTEVDNTNAQTYMKSFSKTYKDSIDNDINSMSEDELDATPNRKSFVTAKQAALQKMESFQNKIQTNIQIFNQLSSNLTTSVSDFLQAGYKLLEAEGQAEKSLLQGWQQIIQTSLQAQAQAYQNDQSTFGQVVDGLTKMIDANMQAYGYRIH